MTDTLDLLEAIGRDASLRHASTDQLAEALARVQANGALIAAVASGDTSRLSAELGRMENQSPESVFSPAHEEESEEGDPLEVPVPDKSISPPEQ